jgi:Zn2+/Cd2+-exporting ATPase
VGEASAHRGVGCRNFHGFEKLRGVGAEPQVKPVIGSGPPRVGAAHSAPRRGVEIGVDSEFYRGSRVAPPPLRMVIVLSVDPSVEAGPGLADRERVVRHRYRIAAGCVDCAADLTPLRRLPGVRDVRLLDSSGVLLVDAHAEVRDAALVRAAGAAGVTLRPEDYPGPGARPQRRPWWADAELVALAASTGLVLAGLVAEHAAGADPLAVGLFAAAIAIGGVYPLGGAIAVVRAGRLTVGVLLVAAAIGALVLGRVAEAAQLVLIFSLGEVLESYTADRARGSIRALMALTPPVAALLRPDGAVETVGVSELAVGDLLLVRPHQRIPTDGRVIEGISWVDAAAVTGESMPVEVCAGSGVFGGTLNGDGVLHVEATTPYADTVLARVIRQVEAAQANRGRAQRFADRFAAVYTPIMFGLAMLVAAAGPLLGLSLSDAAYRALVVLTVSCSCALVISVPVAVIAAIAGGARSGILIKGGVHLEQLAGVDTIAFDKTGTLTQGRPALAAIHTLDGRGELELLALAATVEAASAHPIAHAILDAAAHQGLTVQPSTTARTLSGIGAQATIDGHQIRVGRVEPHLLGDDPAAAPVAMRQLERDGLTPIAVTNDRNLAGLLGVADQLRPVAEPAVAALAGLGIRRVVMLTGDHPAVAAAVAARLGITEIHAGLLPEDKTIQVQAMRAQGVVAMVGDGVNDAPAMAHADVAIAMGAASSDGALETADIALVADDLNRLPTAIRLARRARTIIRQNIALSLATIAVLVAAALAGAFTLTAGIVLNEGTALLIIANGLRLLRHREA